jgi:hypothetical protein
MGAATTGLRGSADLETEGKQSDCAENHKLKVPRTVGDLQQALSDPSQERTKP